MNTNYGAYIFASFLAFLVFGVSNNITDLLLHLKHRNQLGNVLKTLNFKIGVELGVQAGYFSIDILKRWKSCQSYTLTDSWNHIEDYTDSANVATSAQLKMMAQAKHNLRRWSSKTIFIRNLTSEAAVNYPDGTADFIYVDARHDYCGVKEDIEMWWSKLKSGGILAGHDYMTGY
jgi:hypothetical protein